MKSKEELTELKERYKKLAEELRELSEEELHEVVAGIGDYPYSECTFINNNAQPQGGAIHPWGKVE